MNQHWDEDMELDVEKDRVHGMRDEEGFGK
jgi:hypothetical protein